VIFIWTISDYFSELPYLYWFSLSYPGSLLNFTHLYICIFLTHLIFIHILFEVKY
jgi:hypothetical protein